MSFWPPGAAAKVNNTSTQSLQISQSILPDLRGLRVNVRYEKTRSRGAIIMRTHIFPFLLAAIAIGGAAVSSPSVERRDEVAQFDFASLHDQATSALQALRVSRERRMALQQTDESVF
jgi:hypothetical protein